MPSFQLTTNKTVPYTPTDVDCVYTSRQSHFGYQYTAHPLSYFDIQSLLTAEYFLIYFETTFPSMWPKNLQSSRTSTDNIYLSVNFFHWYRTSVQALMSSPVLPSTPVNRCIICWSVLPSSYYNFNYTAQYKIYSEDIFFQNKTIWFPFSENLVIRNFHHINVSVMFVICFQHLALFSPSL